MPLYDYECLDCGITFDIMCKFEHADLQVCEECKSGNIERQVSAPNVHFKGDGWETNSHKKG